MNRKKILIVAPFCSLPGEPYFNRFLYLAFLMSDTYDVTLVTSRFRHFDKKMRGDAFLQLPFNLILLDEPGYNSNAGLMRVYSHRVFCRNFRAWFSGHMTSFDIVYSAYPLIGTNFYLQSVKHVGGFKLVVDVQDVWPESFSSVLPFLRHIHPRLLPFSRKADLVYRNADVLVAVSQTYMTRAKMVAREGVLSTVVYIGSDLSPGRAFAPDSSFFRLGYLGTLSYSYDLETIVIAVNELNHEGVPVFLDVLGGGPLELRLKKVAGSNVKFHGFLPLDKAALILDECAVAVNPIKKSALQSVTNKISDYLALGLPVLNSQTNVEVLGLLKNVEFRNYSAGSVSSAKQAIKALYSLRGSLARKPQTEFKRCDSYVKILEIIQDAGLSNEKVV